jgi:PAS domain S-box-containing protein
MPAVLAAAGVGNVAANLVAGDGPVVALLFALCNLLEVLICVLALRRFDRKADLTRPRTLAIFCGLALLVAPTASALAAAGLLAVLKGAPFWEVLQTWYPADALGLVTITPLLLGLRPRELAGLFDPDRRRSLTMVLAVLVAVLAVVFLPTGYPLLFVIFPALLFAAFRLGSPGALLALSVTAVAAFAATLTGHGPLASVAGDLRTQIQILQAFVAVTSLTVLQLAATLAERNRLERDLSRAKQDEGRTDAARRENAARLQVTLEHMDQGLIMADGTGHVRLYNDRALALLDLPAELMATSPSIEALFAWQQAQGEFTGQQMPVMRKAVPLANGQQPDFYERVRPNGKVLEIRTAPLPGGGFVRTYTDATQRHHAAATTEASEALYRLLAENANDMIGRTSLDGVRRYVSPAAERILGYQPSELIGTRPIDYVHPDDVGDLPISMRRLAEGEIDEVSSVHRLRHKAGHWVWVQVRLRLVRDAIGGPQEFVTATRDFTAEQARAEDLKQAREAAEAALARAEQANQAKTEFLASMSHEIRTPLNSIIGFTERILDRHDIEPVLRRDVELILSSGSALLTVVNDVLDFSRIEAGEVALDPQPFSPTRLVDNAASIVRGLALEKGLDLETVVAPELADWLVGDDDRLRQILLNLLNNAVKFTPAGSIALRVEPVGPPEADRQRVRFSVEDTGIGISRDNQERLFQRFSQVDGSIHRRFGGTGLGLAISKHLVDLMGGTMEVESEAGRGSRFWFTVLLPRSERPADVAPELPIQPARRAHILLVEDIVINQELACSALAVAGHSVDVVSDGASAIEAVQREAYDLVLMDIQMPGMDGVTATEHIRRLGGRAATLPIIAMTANVLPTQIQRFKQAGMSDHVGKPFRRRELMMTIERNLAGTTPASGDDPDAPQEASAPAEPSFDRQTFDGLVPFVGRDRLGVLLQAFADMVTGAFDSPEPPADLHALAETAHTMISTAGSLGFPRFAAHCRVLQRAALGEGPGGDADIPGDVARIYKAVTAERGTVLDLVAALHREVTAPEPV